MHSSQVSIRLAVHHGILRLELRPASPCYFSHHFKYFVHLAIFRCRQRVPVRCAHVIVSLLRRPRRLGSSPLQVAALIDKEIFGKGNYVDRHQALIRHDMLLTPDGILSSPSGFTRKPCHSPAGPRKTDGNQVETEFRSTKSLSRKRAGFGSLLCAKRGNNGSRGGGTSGKKRALG